MFMHAAMLLLVAAAKMLHTTLLIFLLLQLKLDTLFCELPRLHELVVMLLLQHWHELHRVHPGLSGGS